MSSDERLIKGATRGDPRAFEAIYKRYHQELYRFCLAMVSNPQDAQDALQNTMVKVLRALPGEEREIQLKPWLYRIARNESVETLRKRRDSAELEPHQAITSGITETAEVRERLRALLSDLEELPERQRAALVMRELSGLDFDQIGVAFGSSAAVARQTLYEARLSLRQLEGGREMRCADVTRELSDADGRVTRRREIRAHLRSCANCRAFHDDIAKRRENLAALAPLPLAAATGVLHAILGSQAGGIGSAAGSSGLAGTVGAGAGKAVATSAIVKSAATVAVVAVVGVSAADRGGLVDLPIPGNGGTSQTQGKAEADGSIAGGGEASGDSGDQSAGAARSPDDAAKAGQRDGESKQGKGVADSSGAKSGSAKGEPSSQMGENPPGGGYGRSASQRDGRPEQLPDAAGQGQQTAANNKAPQATAPPGPSVSGGSHQKPSGGSSPASPPSSAQPESPAAAPTPAPPVGEAPPKAGSGGGGARTRPPPPGPRTLTAQDIRPAGLSAQTIWPDNSSGTPFQRAQSWPSWPRPTGISKSKEAR
jgi:RNA polymerase sigma factor (sigma-70 family)